MVGVANPVPNPMSNSPNLNTNSNIQMIVVKPREPNVVVVTRGGSVMGVDQATYIEPVTQAQTQVRPPM